MLYIDLDHVANVLRAAALVVVPVSHFCLVPRTQLLFIAVLGNWPRHVIKLFRHDHQLILTE